MTCFLGDTNLFVRIALMRKIEKRTQLIFYIKDKGGDTSFALLNLLPVSLVDSVSKHRESRRNTNIREENRYANIFEV